MKPTLRHRPNASPVAARQRPSPRNPRQLAGATASLKQTIDASVQAVAPWLPVNHPDYLQCSQAIVHLTQTNGHAALPFPSALLVPV